MRKFLAQKGKVSYLWRIIRAKFSNASLERKVYTDGKPVEDSQKNVNIQDQRFEVDWEASWANEIISGFDELFEVHQENLQRKFKRVWIST